MDGIPEEPAVHDNRLLQHMSTALHPSNPHSIDKNDQNFDTEAGVPQKTTTPPPPDYTLVRCGRHVDLIDEGRI